MLDCDVFVTTIEYVSEVLRLPKNWFVPGTLVRFLPPILTYYNIMILEMLYIYMLPFVHEKYIQKHIQNTRFLNWIERF